MKRAIVLTYNHFPDGDAGAVRQAAFAKMLSEIGFEVLVVGMGPYTDNKIKEYDGIAYTSFRNERGDVVSKFKNYFGFSKKLKLFLQNQEKFDLMLVIDLPLGAMKRARRYAEKNDCVLIHDSVEWYSVDEFKLGFFSPEYFKKDYKNRFFYKKPWRIIGISSFLTEHFRKKGLIATRIPVILDIKNDTFVKRCETDKTVIMYAGNPVAKDYFDQVVVAVDELDDSYKKKTELRIFGVTNEQFRGLLSIPDDRWSRIHNVIKCYGRVPREQIIENLEKADFTILLRDPQKRYAKAGFPTKVPESLSTGTPVICNLSSDLGDYLTDMENSVIVENHSSDSIKKALMKAIDTSAEERSVMQKNAFETAKKYFDYHNYSEAFQGFIDSHC